jgi:hypothetical protein
MAEQDVQNSSSDYNDIAKFKVKMPVTPARPQRRMMDAV